ncbi:DoxX family membrane protein [Sediminibacterium sp.]|uniref:DoxX family membrane protein n=1 Tax=Sediminibacterium sp. TaxID=1917865 RepID=UPI003F69C72D
MKTKMLNILSILSALLFLNGGLNKLFNYIPVPPDLPPALVADNAAFMEIEWLMPLVAIVEIIGGLLLIFRKTRAIGALVIFPIMCGILLIHATVAQSGLPLAIGLSLILGWIMLDSKNKYLSLLD